MANSPLLNMQAPAGMPLSDNVEVISDPLLPPQSARGVLSHFFDEVYDLRPESHLSRLLGVLLGDAGVGLLRKKYTYTHLNQTLQTAHFYDIDRLFADVFGFRRFLAEALVRDPYTENGTLDEWEAVLAADASYRNRVEQFVRGVNWGATLPGMHLVASAVLGSPVRIYEAYNAIDDEEAYDPGYEGSYSNYGDLEVYDYGQLDGMSYAEMEGQSAYDGRTPSRTEFIVRPLRVITSEEQYHLVRVLNRLKPVGTMLTVDPRGVETVTRVEVTSIHSPSSQWSIKQEVVAAPEHASAYQRYSNGDPVEQPRPVFSEYQGEEWFYNSDVLEVTAYAVDEGQVLPGVNFERVVEIDSRKAVDFPPDCVLASADDVARGRTVREGVLVANPVERSLS